MNNWPKHIEACLKASIEHGPDARFVCSEHQSTDNIDGVLLKPHHGWELVKPKLKYTEQWGNEYVDSRMCWSDSLDMANGSAGDSRIALHYRRISASSGKTIFFVTLEVFK